jgi:hypothetical protein
MLDLYAVVKSTVKIKSLNKNFNFFFYLKLLKISQF